MSDTTPLRPYSVGEIFCMITTPVLFALCAWGFHVVYGKPDFGPGEYILLFLVGLIGLIAALAFWAAAVGPRMERPYPHRRSARSFGDSDYSPSFRSSGGSSSKCHPGDFGSGSCDDDDD